MILIDSNIPMYLIGAPHPHKDRARTLLETCIDREERLVTDAEVFQEILHRYVAIGRRDAIQPAFDALLGLVSEVLPIALSDVRAAKDVVNGHPNLSARDAVHVAVMQANGIEQILSFDRGFDQVSAVQRIFLTQRTFVQDSTLR